MKRITLLGATGSIGQSTLDVIGNNPDMFSVVAVSAHNNVAALAKIAVAVKAEFAVITNPDQAATLERALAGSGIKIAAGADALVEAALYPTDYIMAGVSGIAGLPAVLAAASQKVKLAIANKEAIICGGALLKRIARQSGCEILPVDSEHHALNQLITDPEQIVRAILTASGGPFRDYTAAEMTRITPEQAICHPVWDMGAKISVDSATLMNKTLELIEAHFLFDLAACQLEMVIHRQSIVHALLELQNGGISAFMGQADMHAIIADVLSLTRSGVAPLNAASLGTLDFAPVDRERFPAASFAAIVLQRGGAAPAILNIANEVAVAGFFAKRIKFTDIALTVADVLESTIDERMDAPNHLDDILELDQQIRALAGEKMRKRLC